jgi:hypothetical protein
MSDIQRILTITPFVPGATVYIINFSPVLPFVPDGIWAMPSGSILSGNGFSIGAVDTTHTTITFKNAPGGLGAFSIYFYYSKNS